MNGSSRAATIQIPNLRLMVSPRRRINSSPMLDVTAGVRMAESSPVGVQACAGTSGQDVLHDVAVHVGQAEVAALEAVGEALVLDAQQVQHGRLEVVHVHGLLDDVDAQ